MVYLVLSLIWTVSGQEPSVTISQPKYISLTLQKPTTSFTPTYTSPLDVYLLSGSGWTEAHAISHLNAAQSVYADCNIYWTDIRLFTVTTKSTLILNKHESTQNSGLHISALANILSPTSGRKIIYLVGEFSDDTQTAFSRAPFEYDYGKTDPALYYSVWYPFDVIEQANTKPYSILAHELTHLYLLEGSHLGGQPEPDIMSISKLRNNRISPYCESIISRLSAHPK